MSQPANGAVKRRTRQIIRNPDLFLFRIFILPFVAVLPSFLAYGVAVVFGDLRCRWSAFSRRTIRRNLQGVYGSSLSDEQCKRITRDFFRLRSCEMLDEMRLMGKGRSLINLVEIRGLENLKSSLQKGKGAILCGAHYGSSLALFSMLNALGYPVTAIGRWSSGPEPNQSFVERLVYNVKLRPATHHLKRPNILVKSGNIGTAFQAAAILRQDEMIYTNIDATVSSEDLGRAVTVDFLKGEAQFLPGPVTISQLTGAPVVVALIHRSSDWRHQVLDISKPVSLEGGTAMAYRRCLVPIEAAINSKPAHWKFWIDNRLMKLGLLRPQETAEP